MERLDQVLPGSPPEPGPPSPYPETLLHETPHANRYYGAFQCHTRQFIPSDAPMVRFANLELLRALQQKVAHWDTAALRPGAAPAKSLFLWSSTDRAVAARRRALEHAQHDSPGAGASSERDSRSPAPDQGALAFVRRAGAAAERESNGFVQQRLAAIKAHHAAAASLKVDERKRRDHEARAARARHKEQAYERAVQAAIAEQAQRRRTGFLGLFGARNPLGGFTLDADGGSWHVPLSPKRASRVRIPPSSPSRSPVPPPEVMSPTVLTPEIASLPSVDPRSPPSVDARSPPVVDATSPPVVDTGVEASHLRSPKAEKSPEHNAPHSLRPGVDAPEANVTDTASGLASPPNHAVSSARPDDLLSL